MKKRNTGKFLVLFIVSLFAIIIMSCGNKKESDNKSKAIKPSIQITKDPTMPYKGGRTDVYLNSRNAWNLYGKPYVLNFLLINHDIDSSYTLSNLPSIKNGKWINGEITAETFGRPFFITPSGNYDSNNTTLLKTKMNTTPLKFPAMELKPGYRIEGDIILDDYFEFPGPGYYRITLTLVFDSINKEESIIDSYQSIICLKLDYSTIDKKEGNAIEEMATGISSFYVDNSKYPPPYFRNNFPGMPVECTTPIAYLSVEKNPELLNIAYLKTNIIQNGQKGHEVFMIASKGPDHDWDIEPLFKSYNTFTIGEIESFTYDPTNGAKSSGDFIFHSHDTFYENSELTYKGLGNM